MPLKDYLHEHFGVTVNTRFVDDVLREADRARPAASLNRAMKEALAFATG